MKYFIDTEFIEGFKKPIKWLPTIGNFNKPYHFIQLISIGIICEDGREYYAISNEYNYHDASEWVKSNVIAPIYRNQISAFKQQFMDISTFHRYIPSSKSNSQIANDAILFCGGYVGEVNSTFRALPEFYAYFADYDWVVFCSLFGTMMDLPKWFPMYCRDLKQMLDDTQEEVDFQLKEHPNYPKNSNEHNAIDDARWNFKLYNFLKTCK